jgi:hypothetical protein
MSAIRSEQTEAKDDDSNLAAVSEVEAGIRDFVRNDIAYLRRPVPGMVNNSAVKPPPAPKRRWKRPPKRP